MACESLSGRNPRFLSLPLPPPGRAGARKFGQSAGEGGTTLPTRAILTLGGLGQIFVQQRLPPELPRATRPRQGAHKRTDIFRLFFLSPGCPKSRPSWGLDLSTPCPSGGFGPNLCSTKIASRASQGHRAAPMSPQEENILTKISKNSNKFEKSRTNRAPELKLSRN